MMMMIIIIIIIIIIITIIIIIIIIFFFIVNLAYNVFFYVYEVLLPFGNRLLKYFPDPFNFEKIGSVAANIITERTKASGRKEGHVSFTIL